MQPRRNRRRPTANFRPGGGMGPVPSECAIIRPFGSFMSEDGCAGDETTVRALPPS